MTDRLPFYADPANGPTGETESEYLSRVFGPKGVNGPVGPATDPAWAARWPSLKKELMQAVSAGQLTIHELRQLGGDGQIVDTQFLQLIRRMCRKKGSGCTAYFSPERAKQLQENTRQILLRQPTLWKRANSRVLEKHVRSNLNDDERNVSSDTLQRQVIRPVKK